MIRSSFAPLHSCEYISLRVVFYLYAIFARPRSSLFRNGVRHWPPGTSGFYLVMSFILRKEPPHLSAPLGCLAS